MKSYVSFLQGLFRAILVDCTSTFPNLRVEFERDAKRLTSLVETRGLHFAMIDLPDACKHFERSLACGRLTRFEMCAMRPFRSRGIIPRLFRGLFLRVFNESGELRDDCCVHSIRFLRQLMLAAKKFKMECSNERRQAVVEQFFAIESEIRPGSAAWDLDEPGWGRKSFDEYRKADGLTPDPQGDLFDLHEVSETKVDSAFLVTLDRVAKIVSSTVGRFDPGEWSTKHGPGAVADLRSGSDKYQFPTWDAKLERVFPYADFAFANYTCWVDTVTGEDGVKVATNVEPPSKLILVPKTLKAPRLIASEPTSHQWCQQALKAFFASRSESTWIRSFVHFRDQTPNQELAVQGSRDGQLATVDLSEASDRLTCWTVERFFDGNTSLLDALQAVRTRWVENNLHPKLPRFHKLRKFACMGSACTFPVQSLVFLGIALASVIYSRKLEPTLRTIRTLRKQVRVFGDDIVVPVDSVGALMDMLEHLQLKVNRNKTFYTGRFRESCGVDAYGGTDVTPVYALRYPDKTRPESIVSSVATQQNLFDQGLYAAADYMASTIRRIYSYIRDVEIDSGAFGLKAMQPDNSHLRRRLHPKFHRPQMRCLTVKVAAKRIRTKGISMLLQYFTEAPPAKFPWQAGVTSSSRIQLRYGWEG